MFITVDARASASEPYTPYLFDTKRLAYAHPATGGCCFYIDTGPAVEQLYTYLHLDELERVLNCETPGGAAVLLRARKPVPDTTDADTGDRPSSIGYVEQA